MIPAPSPEFAAEEGRRQGAILYFRFTIFPHYFRTGIAAGSGTFVNCAFAAPGRIQVDPGVGNASWTSPTLRATVAIYPVTFVPTWTVNYPGYKSVTVEVRTAASEAGVEAAAWAAMTAGVAVSIYEYYQWRIIWIATRSWFFDTVEEMDERGMWFLDAYNPDNPLQSYFTDSLGGDLAYLDTVRFEGEYRLPPGDIKNAGTLTADAPGDFSDLAAADHTLRMVNRDFRYTSHHPNFVYAGETWWYRKKLRIETGYVLPYGRQTEPITIYEGMILKWGPAPHGVDLGGKYQEHYAEIYSRDAVAQLLEQKVGVPDEDGAPRPLVMGEVLRQAEQLGDETLGAPDRTADFESGDTSELAGVDTGGDGVVAVIDNEPYAGAYCLKTAASSAGAFAAARQELLTSTPLFTTYLRFVTVPEVPIDKNLHFLSLYDAAGTDRIRFYAGADYRVHAWANGSWKETDWYIDQDLGVWLRVSVGFFSANPGIVKLWVSGNEVLTWDNEDWSGYSFKGVSVGPHLAAAESWEIHSDAWKFHNNFYPMLYRVPGGPYAAIGTVYSDGVIKMEKPLTLPPSAAAATPIIVPMATATPLAVRYVGGTVQSSAPANLTKVPAEGAVIFNDLANPPKGTVVFRLTKDAVTHPVDQIEAIITAVGMAEKINTDSFAAAKAATPNDSLGCYFENVTAGDGIKGITSRCLLQLYRSGDQIKLKAYTGQAPSVFELTLTEASLVNLEPVVDMEGVATKVGVKWAWYERNHQFYYVAKDQEAIDFIGLFETELDFSWGGEVGSDNAQMAKAKANLWLTRNKAARERLTWKGFRNLMRIELVDIVQVNIPRWGSAVNYEIGGITVRMDPPRGVDLRLVRYLGE